MTLFGYRLPGMSSLIILALLWEIVGQAGVTFFIPPLSEVISTLIAVLPTPAFQKALYETAYAFIAGVLCATCIGIPVGILIGKSRLLDELLLPWVNVFLSAPLTALVPVLMVRPGRPPTNDDAGDQPSGALTRHHCHSEQWPPIAPPFPRDRGGTARFCSLQDDRPLGGWLRHASRALNET